MRTLAGWIVAVAGLTFGVLRAQEGSSPPAPHTLRTEARPEPGRAVESLPAGFLANEGQWPTPARFVLARRGLVVEVLPDGLVCRRRGTNTRLTLTFVGAREAEVAGTRALPGDHHFFLGSNPARWRTHVKAYAEVTWRGLYPGVDVRLVTTDDGVRYDLLLEPDADLSAVRVQWTGHEGLELAPDGSLSLTTADGPVRQSPPIAWYELTGGGRRSVPCRLAQLDGDQLGFQLAGERLDLPLVVDPGLDFYVFLGGSYFELLNAILEAPDGTLVVGGQTQGPDFPTTPGAVQQQPGFGEDGYIARMDARARTLLYATYLGGNLGDEVNALALSGGGELFITGETFSTNFPVTPGAFRTSRGGWSSAFVTRLSRDGSALVYSTYLSGSYVNNWGNSIAIGSGNEAIVAGFTYSHDFPVTPGALRTIYSVTEAFVTRLNATGSGLVASTFFGGDWVEEAAMVDLDAAGNIVVAGWTESPDIPVTPDAFQPSLRGPRNAFCAVLDPGLSRLIYGTYYGGSGGEFHHRFAWNAAGHLVIAGVTSSTDLPGARGSLQGTTDSFLAILDRSQLVAARYLDIDGGAYDVHIDRSGVVTLSGGAGPGFTTTTTPGAWLQLPRNPRGGGFVSRFGPDLDLWYASYFGGSVGDLPETIERTRDGWTLLGGRGASPDMPTPGVFNSTPRGMNDAFVARMDLLPAGVERYGTSRPACHGPLVMDVNRMPAAGSPDFTIVCSAAPPRASGWLLLSAEPDEAGTPVLGATLHVSVPRFLGALPVASDAVGFAAARLPLDSRWAGVKVFAQFLWIDPPTCTRIGPLSSSNALAIWVQ